jgi:hypothetical protein
MPTDWKAHNRGITPVFYIETVPLFEDAGRRIPRLAADGTPVTTAMEFVRILIAGDGLAEASAPVDDAVRERFADEYAAWKENREQAHQGYSLEEWPPLFGKQKLINELEGANIFSVQDVASVSDANLHCVAHLRELREKAKAWLSDKESHAVTDELAATIASQAARIEAMEREMKKNPRTSKKVRTLSKAARKRLNEARVRNAPKPPPEGVQKLNDKRSETEQPPPAATAESA